MAMGDVIARLSVQLGMDTAVFEKNAKSAAKTTDVMGDRMEKMGFKAGRAIKGLAAAGGALAAGFVVNQLKDMVMESLEYVSSLGEVATQLGVTTSALQQYRYMASQVGIEQGEMDKGLAFLSKTLGKWSLDLEKAEKTLTKYGMSTEEVAKLSKMTAEEALPFLADKYVALTSDTEKAAFAAELFGSKMGAKFKTLLEGGAKGINDMAAAYKKLGIEISPEMIQRADDAADKMSALKQILDAKMAVLVAENADKLIALADALVSLVTGAANLYNAFVKFGETPFAKGLAALERLASLASPIGLTAEAIKRAAQAYDQMSKAPAPKGPAGPIVWPKSGGGVPNSVSKSPSTPLSGDWMKGGKGGKLMGMMGVLGQIDFKQIYADISELPPEANDTLNWFDRMHGAFVEYEQKGTDAGEKIQESFEDTAQGVISSLSRMAGAIKGGNWLDILSGVLDIGLQLAGMGAFGSKIQGNVQARAIGGGISAGRPYLVGERGPEMIVPNKSGRVIPNNRLGGSQAIQVVPSPYFDVVVDGRVIRAAPAIAQAGGQVGMATSARRASRRIA